MSQLFDFKKRFGKETTLGEAKNNFIIKVNHVLIPFIDQKIGAGSFYIPPYSKHPFDDSSSRLFDRVCINFGLEPKKIISISNSNHYNLTEYIPSIKILTDDDFEKTLLLIEIIYDFYKQEKQSDVKDFIDEMINSFVLQPVSIGVFWRNGSFYPEGATELDKVLIQEPLDWLSKYPKIKALYKNALDSYSQAKSNEIKRKDTCINAYQSVEEIAKFIVGEQKPFDSIFGSFADKIGLNAHWKKILNQYREFSKEYGRHSGSTNDFIPDISSTEAFLYLSGLLLRLAVQKIEEKK